jgi:hypothetical protein
VLRARGRRDKHDLYVSLVTPSRTLDLECASREERDRLAAGFRALVQAARERQAVIAAAGQQRR